MNRAEAVSLADRFIAAWNEQDVETLAGCYSVDLRYRDPGTRGEVRGRDEFRRYLTKLFASWQMRWSLREVHPFKEGDGAAVLWHATLRRVGGPEVVEVDGMDLVEVSGQLICRNEVYFYRSVLAPLLAT